MTLTQFMKTYKGKKVDFDKEGTPQCTDLARQYISSVWGLPQPPALGENGGAKDLINNPGVLSVTRESALADYSVGDLLVWGATPTNKYGHVAILVAIYNTKNFIVFEQDGFKKDGAKYELRTRENLLGCLYKPLN